MNKIYFAILVGALQVQLSSAAPLIAPQAPLAGNQAELNFQQVRDFFARKDVTIFAPHQVSLSSSQYFLIKGKKQFDGTCNFPEELSFNYEDLKRHKVYSSIDIAIDFGKCEKIVERGGNLSSAYDVNSPPNDKAANVWTLRKTIPKQQMNASEMSYVELTDANKDVINATVPTYGFVALQIRYTDGNHPLISPFTLLGVRGITANYVDEELRWSAKNFCQGGETLYGATRSDFCAASGWVRDPDANNPLGYLGYKCNYSYYNNQIYSSGYAYAGAVGRYRNSTFPGCQPAVYTNYSPIQINVDTNGKITAPYNTFVSGQISGCGQYLRLFVNIYSDPFVKRQSYLCGFESGN